MPLLLLLSWPFAFALVMALVAVSIIVDLKLLIASSMSNILQQLTLLPLHPCFFSP